MADSAQETLRALIVDDEPLAVERMRAICSRIPSVEVIGDASDGKLALDKIEGAAPDLVLLDLTMPNMDGMTVARTLAKQETPPAVIFVTAHDDHAVEAFDLDAVDYVLKPVDRDRLERAIQRAVSRRGEREAGPQSQWLDELWVPHRSELIRIGMAEVDRIDAERDYVRLHVGEGEDRRSYLLLQTIAGLEAKLDPEEFIRIHRSTILRRGAIAGLRHDGLGVWSAELVDGEALRIGRTYLSKVKAMAGR
ncbi:LytR/AlgR family response regulator transcription factor [Qipengyuania sp.]|uniref:LytR/AlgR family response regulator transcription factor n=1 Tax=Qipengyuania sp. TaxID=2004515 RepID=UPI0035C83EE5